MDRRSSIYEGQYKAYCLGLAFKGALWESSEKSVNGIGGRQIATRKAVIQIPLKDLELSIEVESMFMTDDIPTFLFMKYMLRNRLDTSIQDTHIHFSGQTHTCSMKNYFLIHKWAHTDMLFAQYREHEFQAIYRYFGKQYVRITDRLLRRVQEGTLDEMTRNSIAKMPSDCKA